MIENTIRTEIMQRLKKTEEQEGVRILMAVESGSRAWGFASPNSDYDVRFIYVHDKDWYVAVDFEEKRDVIEYPIVDDIDLSGWDIRKALRLFWKSNPAVVEWIQSPIIYINDSCFREEALNLLPQLYAIEKGIYHYRSMAKSNYRGYLCEDFVPLKKYFYVLKPLFSIRWLEKYGCAAPIEFERVLPLVGDDHVVLDAIAALLERKKRNEEMALAPVIPVLNTFIEKELERLESIQLSKTERGVGMATLNGLFHQVLDEKKS